MELPGLSPQYYEAIGKITVKVSGLERLIMTLVRLCTSLSTWNETTCLLGGDTLDALIKKIDRIIKCNLSDEPDLIRKAEPILDALNEIRENRNLYVHSMWNAPIFVGETLPKRRKFKSTFKFIKDFEQVKPVPIDELNEFIDKIRETSSQFIDFVIGNYHAINAAIERRSNEEGRKTHAHS